MKYYVPAIIIGLVGGILDACTDLHNVLSLLIGIGTFFLYVLIRSIFKTASIMKKTTGAKKIWIDNNNNVIRTESHQKK